MAKPQILTDTFEALAEVGQQTAQQTKKAAVSIVKKAVNEASANKVFQEKGPSLEALKNGKNHTELAGEQMKRLEGIYDGQDQQKMGEVRAKLTRHFRDYKREEEEFHARKKREEEERKRAEEQETAQKKRREEDEKNKMQTYAPKGKVRRNIFQRSVKSSQPETRVGGGK